MQTAGMLRGTGAIYTLVLLAIFIDHAYSHPYQLLPSIPGYVPVYIRNGDQPLEEINPALAEAFHERSSLSKSVRLDRNLDHLKSSDDSRSNSVTDESGKIYYSAQPRESGNAIKDTDEKSQVQKSSGVVQVPKLVSLYELDEKLKKKAQGSDNQSKGTSTVLDQIPLKVITMHETVSSEKGEGKPNDLYDPNPNYPELPADIEHNHGPLQDSVTVIGLDALTERPYVRQYKDLSSLADERNAVDDKNEREQEEQKEEVEPVKVQRPSDILSNVQKLSPIAPPDASNTERLILKSENTEENASTAKSPAVLLYKDLSLLSGEQEAMESSDKTEQKSTKDENVSDSENDAVSKETVETGNYTNVLKLLPIAPPEAYESQEDAASNKVEDKSNDSSLVNQPVQAENIYPYLYPSDDKEDTKTSSTIAKEENKKQDEAPMKVEFPLTVGTNVVKVLPIALPQIYVNHDSNDATPALLSIREIYQEDEKKDLTARRKKQERNSHPHP